MSKSEKQNIKLDKVDDKTAYENLLVKYAELENKIADIKANCDLAIEGRDIKIKELEKENAELKKQIKQIENVSDYNADQLAQAKEIIKDLMSFSVQLCDCRHTVDFEKTREKAEQFLKEIEK